MTFADWNALCTTANAAGFHQLTMAAEENAHFTVHAEKAAPVEQYADLCLASLEGLLSCTDDAEAHAFFRANGVRF